MPRYTRRMELLLGKTEIEKEINLFFDKMDFFRGTLNEEECFCAYYEQAGNTKRSTRLCIFKYSYEDGVLFFETWIQDGKNNEIGFDNLLEMRISRTYFNYITELEDRLLDKLLPQSELYEKNKAVIQEDRTIIERNLRMGKWILMAFIFGFLFPRLLEIIGLII